MALLASVLGLSEPKAADVDVVLWPAPLMMDAPVAAAGDRAPGRAMPSLAAPAGAWHFKWNDLFQQHESWVIIEAGEGTRRPAWVATFTEAGEWEVAYCGRAYLDQLGFLHVDSRGARCEGPLAKDWSPDSISIAPGGQVSLLDDCNRPSRGQVFASLTPERSSADVEGHTFTERTLWVRSLILDCL